MFYVSQLESTFPIVIMS